MVTIQQRLTNVRKTLALAGLDGVLQPVHDEYLSEYPPACYKRVEWLSGFSGSAGMALVLADRAALFVDGRYTLQAASEVDGALFAIHNSGELTPDAWLAREAPAAKIGYDPALFTPGMLARYRKAGIQMIAAANPIDAVWADRPPVPASRVFIHDESIAGESSADKCKRLGASLAGQGADAALIAAPDSVCWLLNIRASDVECTPLLLARALLHADGTVDVFADPSRLPALPAHIRAHAAWPGVQMQGKKILCDESLTPQSLLDAVEAAGAAIVKGSDPCVLPKACKNAAQVAHIRAAHVRDGAAVAKLLHWLASHPDIETVSETDVAGKLLMLRARQAGFVEPSFPTIAGSGPNGAIVHYRASEKTDRRLQKGELLLLDSGGQYTEGTTDITRTIAIGQPSPEHKDRFTRVLKGHIALATALFPKGTRGSQLDGLARQYLWQAGLDYDHGTGHGVGQFLGVHEGPQRISKRGGDAELLPGMILSNEPGYYKTGEYGIRIENLVVVVEKEKNFLGFETLTCAPIDLRLVAHDMLTPDETAWLSHYHSWVKSSLGPLLDEKEQAWLVGAVGG